MSDLLKLVKPRFYVNRLTGMPVSWDEGQKKEKLVIEGFKGSGKLLLNMCINTGLRFSVDYYAIYKGCDGVLVVVGDDLNTTFLWMGDVDKFDLRVKTTIRATPRTTKAIIKALKEVTPKRTPIEIILKKFRNSINHVPELVVTR